MDVGRTQRILTSVMIISFLIFGLLAGIILILDVRLDNATAALPFAFLFISVMTLVTTGQIRNRPQKIGRFLREWLFVVVFVVVAAALAFTVV